MDLPILEKLKEGVMFPFETLADPENIRKTNDFWDWWWDEKWEPGTLTRPEIIESGDEILTETISKPFVDTLCYRDAIDEPLFRMLNDGVIPTSRSLDREMFREIAMGVVSAGARVSPNEAWIVFAGGGYGSGKTTILQMLAKAEVLPCGGTIGVNVVSIRCELNAIGETAPQIGNEMARRPHAAISDEPARDKFCVRAKCRPRPDMIDLFRTLFLKSSHSEARVIRRLPST